MSDQQIATPATATSGPVGIGGWLVLPLIGLVLTPLGGVAQLATYAGISQSLALLTGAQKGFLALEAAGNLVIAVVLPIILLVLLFKKRARFPRLYITWAVLSFVFVLLDLFVAKLLFGELFAAQGIDLIDGETMKTIARSIILVVVWVPYMLNSRRVKNTFTQ